MLTNIILGFVIPWLFGAFLYIKDKKVVLIMFPIGATVSYTINYLGFHFGFWHLTPILKDESMSALPLDLGLFALFPCFLVFAIRHIKNSPVAIILVLTCIATLLEWLGVLFGKVVFGNDWNIGWTFVSYLVPWAICYWYYKVLKKLECF